MLNPCQYCEHYEECETENNMMNDYCDSFTPNDNSCEEDYLDAIIEEGRMAFRPEWFTYISNND